MAVSWTEEDGKLVLTAASVQDLVDELTAKPRTLFEAKLIRCGVIEFSVELHQDPMCYAAGVLRGLQIAQELGVP